MLRRLVPPWALCESAAGFGAEALKPEVLAMSFLTGLALRLLHSVNLAQNGRMTKSYLAASRAKNLLPHAAFSPALSEPVPP